MAKYSLVGVNGNVFAVIGYTGRALKDEGLGNLVEEMQNKAKSGDYNNAIAVCMDYVDKANDKAYENGYEDDDEDEDYLEDEDENDECIEDYEYEEDDEYVD